MIISVSSKPIPAAMPKVGLKIGLAVFLLLVRAGQAQIASAPSKGWTQMSLIYGRFNSGLHRLNLTNNTPEEIRTELLDPNTSRLIAKFNNLSEQDLATVQVSQENGRIEVCQIGNADRAFKTLSEQLRNYASSREEGHTRAFCVAALTNRIALSAITDPHLRALLKKQPTLPVDRLTISASKTYTNKAGTLLGQSTTTTFVNGKVITTNVTEMAKVDEVWQRVSYVLIDGEIAWIYDVDFKPDGSVGDLAENRRDAKEFDPKYRQTIKEVEVEVKSTTPTRRGAIHLVWSLMQEKLKNKGIDWRSPADLNPNSSFD